MTKYPEKSNWISYRRMDDGDYVIYNHAIDEEIEASGDEIYLLEKLDGNVNPYRVLQNEFGMTRQQARDYVSGLLDMGILRRGNKVYDCFLMRTVWKIYNSEKYQKIAQGLLLLLMIAFLPVTYIGCRSAYHLFVMREFLEVDSTDLPMWVEILIAYVLGIVIHELCHAIACCAFGGKVLEFGITFMGFPAAYTMMDTRKISRWGQVITYLAGVMSNLMIGAMSMFLLKCTGKGLELFLMIAFTNVELALVNLLFINGLDGCSAISRLLGPINIYETCQKYLKEIKRKKRRTVTSENEKILAGVFRIFCFCKLIYPIVILFNLCIFLGW